MKLIKSALLTAIAMTLSAAASAADGVPGREHRGIYMTPFLGQNWPSSAITASNANSLKNILAKKMTQFKDEGVTAVYYHARANCDATYDSKYEPWSANVSGTRGVAPVFDPFGYLVEQAHANGIEAYAWINPYRYCSGNPKYGTANDNDYENCHPDWLLIYEGKETILNPGLEEVKQRICDVIADILDKYDVDGIIFDDYFYTSGTPLANDADLYNKYKANGGTLSQTDWRRANVNEMVQRVYNTIKAKKPYCAFGISPAGACSPPTVTSVYGLDPAPGGGDWQYGGIYSDPLAWYKAGTIDFMAPQIYWPNRFDALSEWWNIAARKFDRHCYPAITLSDFATYKMAEYIRETEVTRNVSAGGASGQAWFEYAQWVNKYENMGTGNKNFGDNMGLYAYPTKAKSPLRYWESTPTAEPVSNVAISGSTLTWTANAAGRYTVYAHAKAENTPFTTAPADLHGIVYTNSYELPTNAADYDWYVAAYNRYGAESSALGVGKTITAGAAPVNTYPANGGKSTDLFTFTWTNGATGNAIVEVSTDAAFKTLVGACEANGNTLASVAFPTLKSGVKYYWRVTTHNANEKAATSAATSFTIDRMAITSPAASSTGVSLTPTITWTAAGDGALYTLSVKDAAGEVFSIETKTNSAAVPAKVLSSGRTYTATVTATIGSNSVTTEPLSFTTADRSDYAAPTLVNPAVDGQTLHCNDVIRVADWDGMNSVQIELCATNTFPTRSKTVLTLTNFATSADKMMSEIKISSKELANGSTYYVRVRGVYSLSTATANQYTDYSPIHSFVYSSEAGVNDITCDQPADAPAVRYNLQGVETPGNTPGLYIERRGTQATKVVVK